MYQSLSQCQSFKIPPPIMGYDNQVLIEEIPCDNIKSPSVWGPIVWHMLFSGAAAAPVIVPRADRSKYWSFIRGLPYMLPCQDCREHAKIYVDKSRGQKEHICSSRHNLIKFFVDFHNSVSKRKGEKSITIREVEHRFLSEGPMTSLRVSYL